MLLNNSKINVIAPTSVDLLYSEDFLRRNVTCVFAGQRMDLLHQLSQKILKHNLLRGDSGCVALAFWLRKSNLQKMKDVALARYASEDNMILVPVGRVFHIAPTNVDTMFVYSWALSFYIGNRNVIRLSARLSPVVRELMKLINELMDTSELLRSENAFVSYERDDAINQMFSEWCSHRVVWGGDETVAALRNVRLNPHASERSFASKYSWSIIDASEYAKADEAAVTQLAEKYYNDIFAFDQMACSSPQVIFWRGERAKVQEISAQFDQRLRKMISQKKREDLMTHAVKRRNHAFSLAVQGGVIFDPVLPAMTSVFVDRIENISRETCGAGFIQHAAVMQWEELTAFCQDKDQTVTHYGIEESLLRELAQLLGARGVDRIVPVGQALDFQVNWDGFSLVQDYIRTVEVR